MPYNEAHITMEWPAPSAQELVENARWKFSVIDGDILLGSGSKCYATRHFKASQDPHAVLDELRQAAAGFQQGGCTILRQKIELVIYDTRSSKLRTVCTGGCPECHGD
jgi:hypothetical protein